MTWTCPACHSTDLVLHEVFLYDYYFELDHNGIVASEPSDQGERDDAETRTVLCRSCYKEFTVTLERFPDLYNPYVTDIGEDPIQ